SRSTVLFTGVTPRNWCSAATAGPPVAHGWPGAADGAVLVASLGEAGWTASGGAGSTDGAAEHAVAAGPAVRDLVVEATRAAVEGPADVGRHGVAQDRRGREGRRR